MKKILAVLMMFSTTAYAEPQTLIDYLESINNTEVKVSGKISYVDKRHQFSPLQLVDVLLKYNYKIIDIHPANYHPVVPSLNIKNKKYKGFAQHIFNLNEKNKLPYIPFSSTFMITAKKV